MNPFAPLNFPPFVFRRRKSGNVCQIWDGVRHKWLVLTPEEWVRQHFIRYMTEHLNVLPVQIVQEYPVSIGGMPQRADIVVCGKSPELKMVVECKACDVRLNDEIFAQAMRYNSILKARYVAVTNGLSHYCFEFDDVSGKYTQLSGFPDLRV